MEAPLLRVLKVSRLQHILDAMLLAALERKGRKLRRSDVPIIAARVNDEVGHEIAVQGYYERDLLSAIATFLIPRAIPDAGSAIAVDVGANIGNHSIFFSRYFENVIAVEPNPNAAALLKANLDANSITNVKMMCVGLSDETGTLPFVEHRFNLGASRFRPDEQGSDRHHAVLPVIKGDEAIASMGLTRRIALIKIDAEGFERRVVLGLKETLGKHAPVVLFEALNGKAAVEVADALAANGYRYFYNLDRRRVQTSSVWFRRVYRLIVGSNLYFQQLVHFGDWVHPLIVATVSPI
jgi:FkbM family methyltransferase